MDLSVSSSSWGLGRTAVCDCGTPWTFFLPVFDTDLSKIIEINYKPKIESLKCKIKAWHRRYLTPLGKITVIKSILTPCLNHLFLSLFDQNEKNEINDIFFTFLLETVPTTYASIKHYTKAYTGCNLNATKLLDYALIGACAVIR